jgi:amidase
VPAPNDYASLDAIDLAELIRKGETTARELAECAVSRAERVNPRLNAIITPMYGEARSRAEAGTLGDGPLSGVPFVVKDLGPAVAGQRFTRGSRLCAQQVADHDGELVRRYRRAGLNIIGKTNTPELGLMPVTEPELHGPTENPWAIGRTAGGSSGGSASAVAAGVVPVGHANDGGGSIRIPASCCGLFGLKPTRGRVPVGPDVSEGWFGFAIDHVVSRSVRDSAAFLDATHGPEPGATYVAPPVERPYLDEVGANPGRLKIALCTSPLLPSQPEDQVIEATNKTARLCEELGHTVVPAMPPIDKNQFALDNTLLVCVATACDLEELGKLAGRKPGRSDVELSTWMSALLGRVTGAMETEQARRRMHKIARDAAGFFGDYDVLLTPTIAQIPVPHGALRPPPLEQAAQEIIAAAGLTSALKLPRLVERVANQIYQLIPWTPFANVAGLPSMSLPLHMSREGLPIGVMFTGGFGQEATLFRLAAQLEEAATWRGRRPPIFAQ